jgi:hypothetical protein
MADWADGHGWPAAIADCVPAALDMVRRLPFVAVVCGGHVLVTHETFGDRLHRRQPRTALIVLDAATGSTALPEALEQGAVDRLVPPCDRTRFGVALARAEEWATNSEACRRRAMVVVVNGRVRALERILVRQISAWGSEPVRRLRGHLGDSPGWAEGRGSVATAGLSIVSLRRAAGGEGSQPRLDAISRTLAAVVTARMVRAQASDPDWTEYCRALATPRVAQVVARLWGQTADPPQAQGLDRRLRPPDESRRVAGAGAAA